MMHKFTSTRRFQASALALALAATVCFGSLVSADNRFTDVPDSHWAHDAIEYVVDEGLFAGTSETTFNPEGTMTRAMLWVVLARMDDVNTNASSGEAWYQPGLDWAVKNGISDGTNPNNNITREQFASMLYRYAENAGEGITVDTSELNKFIDTINIASYALEPLAWAVENGIVSGTSSDTISPAGNATRAQVATMLMRYDQAFNSDAPDGGEEPGDGTEATSITMSLNNSTLKVGETTMVTAKVFPDTAPHTWTCESSNPSVATVTKVGWIEAKAPGTTTITVTTPNGKTDSATLTVTEGNTSSGEDTDEIEEAKALIVELTNEIRAENGKPALVINEDLMDAAQARAEECASIQSISHIRPNGEGYSSIIQDYIKFKIDSCGEVNAMSYNGLVPEETVDNWEKSEGHFKTMISSEYRDVGVGIARDSNGNHYYTQIFIGY